MKSMKLTFVVVCLKVISAQRIPKLFSATCRENIPTERPSNCCEIPNLFDIETHEGCGEVVQLRELALRGSPEIADGGGASYEKHQAMDLTRSWKSFGAFVQRVHTYNNLFWQSAPLCAERTCLLRNNDLLFDNDEIDIESFKQYLDEWVQKRREFQSAVDTCKLRCLGNQPLFGPNQMCPAEKLLLCIDSTFFNKCPDWRNTESCRHLRTYLESCFPYYD